MRASEYPIPDYAAYVWSRGDALMISLPDYGRGDGQTLCIPAERLSNDKGMPKGLRALWDILNARRNDVLARIKPRFATASEPTQLMLEEAMKVASRNPPLARSTEIDIFAEGED